VFLLFGGGFGQGDVGPDVPEVGVDPDLGVILLVESDHGGVDLGVDPRLLADAGEPLKTFSQDLDAPELRHVGQLVEPQQNALGQDRGGMRPPAEEVAGLNQPPVHPHHVRGLAEPQLQQFLVQLLAIFFPDQVIPLRLYVRLPVPHHCVLATLLDLQPLLWPVPGLLFITHRYYEIISFATYLLSLHTHRFVFYA
jgi:hypothetical protein